MVRVIMVHGRGAGSSYRCILAYVREVLKESVRRVDPTAGSWLATHPQTIQLVYYADLIRKLTGETPEPCKGYRKPIDRLYRESQRCSRWLAFRGAMRDLGIDVAAALLRFTSFEFRSRLLRRDFKEVRAYLHDPAFAAAIRARLEAVLIPALAKQERVMLIAHSFGSVVAYDVLWMLSHRSTSVRLKAAKVERFVTLGSPLGDEPLKRRLLGRRRGGLARFPTNIRSWHNLSARGDAIAHDARLADDFRAMVRHRLIEEIVDHIGLGTVYRSREGVWNPHKLYGYLLLPEVGRLVARFLKEGAHPHEHP